MRRYTETNNLILYIVLVKLRRSVATIAVKDKQTIGSCYTRRYISIKVLQLLKSKLISRLAIITQRNYPVSRQTIILAYLVELSRQDNNGQDRPARRVNSFNYRYLVTISRLYNNCLTNSIRAYNNLQYSSNAYYKSSLIKVVAILVKDTIRLIYLLYKLKLRVNYNRIFILCAL